MDFYNDKTNLGEFWIKNINNNVMEAPEVLSFLYEKYYDLEPSFYYDLSSNNILKIDVFYDTLYVKTSSGFIFEKYYMDANSNLQPYSRFNFFQKLTGILDIDYWFDDENKKIYYCGFNDLSGKNVQSFIFNFFFKVFDINTSDVQTLHEETVILNFDQAFGWSNSNGIKEDPKLTYNNDTQLFNISFLVKNDLLDVGIISINLNENDIKEINCYIPYATVNPIPTPSPTTTPTYTITPTPSVTLMGIVKSSTTIDSILRKFEQIILSQNNVPMTYPSGNAPNNDYLNASQTILDNKANIQQQIVDYVNYYYPNPIFTYNPTLTAKCYRDVGYIVDALAADLANYANHRSIEVGNMYFQGTTLNPIDPNSTVKLLPSDEVVSTIAAISAISIYINGNNIPTDIPSFTTNGLLSAFADANNIGNFINNLVSTIIYPLENNGKLLNYIPNGSPTLIDIDTANLISKNKTNIQNEVGIYVKQKNYLTDPNLIAKCKRDTGLIIDSVINDLSNGVIARSIEYALAYWEGSTSRLPENLITYQKTKTIDTINFINKMIKDVILKDSINGLNNFRYIILNKDNAPQTIPSGLIQDNSYQIASQRILDNKSNLQQQIVDFVKIKYPNLFTYNLNLSAKCYRDVGYIVDAISADIANNTNHRSIEVGNLYFQGTLMGGVNKNSSIPTLPSYEIEPTINAINALTYYITGENIPKNIKTFTNVGILSSVDTGINRRKDVYEKINTVLYPLKQKGKLLNYIPAGMPSKNDQYIANLISRNKTIIQKQVADYVKQKRYFANSDLAAKCNRDVGLMIDSIINDLSTGVNARSIQYALAYWEGSTSRLPENTIIQQKSKTIDIINFLDSCIKNITTIQYPLTPTPTPSNTTKNLGDLAFYTKSSQSIQIDNSIDNINNIIYDYKKTPPTIPSGYIYDDSFSIASKLILDNKTNIQQQIVDYVNYYYPNPNFTDNPTLTAKCYRDVGYIVDALAADLLNDSNHRCVEVGNLYFKGTTLNPIDPNSTVPMLPADEVTSTIAAISAISIYINGNNIPTDIPSFTENGLLSSFDTGFTRCADVEQRIYDIIYPLQNNGALRDYYPIGIPSQTDIDVANYILQNKSNLQSLVFNFVKNNGYITNDPGGVLAAKCNRDTGLIIDAIAYDLSSGVTARSIEYGLTYWEGSTTRLRENTVSAHKLKTISTYNYLNKCIKDLLVEFGNIDTVKRLTPSNTPTRTHTSTHTITRTQTRTQTQTSVTRTPHVTKTPTKTPRHTPSNTRTPTNTFTPSQTVTVTPTNTTTNTPTNSETPTQTPTVTTSPSETPTNTPTVTSSPSETPTQTPTQTPTSTTNSTPTPTPTQTQTSSNTPTPSVTQTQTPSITPTHTPTKTPRHTKPVRGNPPPRRN